MQGHQAPRFFSHRQSPWCAALSWRNSDGRQVPNLGFIRLNSTCPFPLMTIKPVFIGNLYRERLLSQKANQNVFSQPTVPLQKREGTIVSVGTWYTTFISHKFIKSSSIKIWSNQERKPSCTVCRVVNKLKRYKFG